MLRVTFILETLLFLFCVWGDIVVPNHVYIYCLHESMTQIQHFSFFKFSKRWTLFKNYNLRKLL